MTQKERVRKYINEFGSITPLDAFNDLGITKLATVVSTMKRDGEFFYQRYEKSKNRWGEPVHYMRYSYKPFKEEKHKTNINILDKLKKALNSH